MNMDDYLDDDELDAPPVPRLKAQGGSEICGVDSFKDEAIGYVPEPSDFASVNLTPIARQALTSELAHYDLYLHNIAKAFRSATTISSLISLVHCGLTVNKQRRDAVQLTVGQKDSDIIEFDLQGNPIIK